MNKITTTIVAVLALVLGLLIGHSFWPQTAQVLSGANSVGTTFGTQKMAAIVFVPLTTSATTTSVLNGDANDRYVTSSFSYCGGVGSSPSVSTLTFTAATTSTNAPASLGTNTNYVMNISVATSTADNTNATSTFGSPVWQRWSAGSYVTFASNATNTAVCTVGVNYIPS